MKDILVGCTGFVGQNLMAAHSFELAVHSTDIEKAYGSKPELLVYSGVPAEMFLANTNPEADYARILKAQENIERICPKKLVLISTVAVCSDTMESDEDTPVDESVLSAYGRNRYALEKWAREHTDATIVRLPALYGIGLKKNFLYDLIHLIPPMLKEDKYQKLLAENPACTDLYELADNGFYKLRKDADESRLMELREYYRNSDFNALSFTDARSRYQFYHLENLWNDIQTALSNNLPLLGLMTQPLSVAEIYSYLTGKEFTNQLAKEPFNYDVRTSYSKFWGREDGYIQSGEQVLERIRRYVEENS